MLHCGAVSGILVQLQRGNHFAETSTRARATISELGARFIRSGNTVLCHGHRSACARPLDLEHSWI